MSNQITSLKMGGGPPTGKLLDAIEGVDKLLALEAEKVKLIWELRRTLALRLIKAGLMCRFAKMRGERCPICGEVVRCRPEEHECRSLVEPDLVTRR